MTPDKLTPQQAAKVSYEAWKIMKRKQEIERANKVLGPKAKEMKDE